jgi:hypothetical protein
MVATNQFGDSTFSMIANGAIIVRVPDAPFNLLENKASRTISTLGIQWNDGT